MQGEPAIAGNTDIESQFMQNSSTVQEEEERKKQAEEAEKKKDIIPGIEDIDEDTIDEPVTRTIWRDVRAFGIKLFHVLFPHGKGPRALRDWDLWGPLILCFGLELFLFIGDKSPPSNDPKAEGYHVLLFTLVWIIVWVGASVVTLNTQLIGGNLSFFQCVCLLGYCLFPLNVAALLCTIPGLKLFKLLIVPLCIAWSSFASLGFFAAAVPPQRKAMALYPTFMFYVVIGSLIIVKP